MYAATNASRLLGVVPVRAPAFNEDLRRLWVTPPLMVDIDPTPLRTPSAITTFPHLHVTGIQLSTSDCALSCACVCARTIAQCG